MPQSSATDDSLPVHERKVCVLSSQGLHLRPADLIVRMVSEVDAEVWITKGSERVDCRSILSLITLGAAQDSELLLSAQGPDAAAVLETIGEFFDQGFHELNDQDSSDPASTINQNTP